MDNDEHTEDEPTGAETQKPGARDEPDGTAQSVSTTDLDLRDEALVETGAPEVYREGDQVILDLRELAPTGRQIPEGHPRSGRPPDMLPQHRVITITGGDLWKDAERFVYEVYVELGYTSESSRQQVEELVRFADRSQFHAVVDEENSIVGTIRAILGSFEDLPVGKFRRVDFEDDGLMCELSSIVADPRVRSKGVIEHLYREGWANATRDGAKAITGVGEKWLLDAFRNTYAMPFVPVGVPEWYMGGEVIPMIMSNGIQTHTEVVKHNPGYWYWNLEVLTEVEIERFGLAELAAGRNSTAPTAATHSPS